MQLTKIVPCMEHAGYVPEYVLRSSTSRTEYRQKYVCTCNRDWFSANFWFYRVPKYQYFVLCMYKNKVAIPIRGQVKFCTSKLYDMHKLCATATRVCSWPFSVILMPSHVSYHLFKRLCCSYCPSNQHFRMIVIPKWKFTAMPDRASKWRNSPTSVEQNLHFASVPDPGVVLTVHKPLVNCTVWSTYGARRVNYSVIRGWRRCPRGTPYWWLSLSDYYSFVRITILHRAGNNETHAPLDSYDRNHGTMDAMFLDEFRNRLIQALFRSIPRQREYSVLQTVLSRFYLICNSIWICSGILLQFRMYLDCYQVLCTMTYFVRMPIISPEKTSGEYVRELVSSLTPYSFSYSDWRSKVHHPAHGSSCHS